jgi:hypothetical protein
MNAAIGSVDGGWTEDQGLPRPGLDGALGFDARQLASAPRLCKRSLVYSFGVAINAGSGEIDHATRLVLKSAD